MRILALVLLLCVCCHTVKSKYNYRKAELVDVKTVVIKSSRDNYAPKGQVLATFKVGENELYGKVVAWDGTETWGSNEDKFTKRQFIELFLLSWNDNKSHAHFYLTLYLSK